MLPQLQSYRFLGCIALLFGWICCFGWAGDLNEITEEKVNEALGIPMFAEGINFWDESAKEVAMRLRWPQESKTSVSSSYRSYVRTKILGATAYSMVLHAEDDKPVSVSLVFANKGDTPPPKEEMERNTELRRVTRSVMRQIAEEAKALQRELTALFGDPSKARTGASSQTAEQSYRWDWNGSSFLLASPRGEYVSLRIIPTADLEESGIERVHRRDLVDKIASRVERRENGDVVITDIPMVDQGPKGFCVPATWERSLRYMGIPADMYVLAMAGDTNLGGGTTTAAIVAGAKQLVQRYGRRIDTKGEKVSVQSVSRYIDRGIPIMWGMFSTREFNDIANDRTGRRSAVTDWQAWKKEIAEESKRNSKVLRPDRDTAHLCMIIGYNRETGEVAVSDSWGPAFEIRWVTAEEAQAISQGEFMFILP